MIKAPTVADIDAAVRAAMDRMKAGDEAPQPTREELRRMVENRRRGIPRSPGDPCIYVRQRRVPMQEISRPLQQTERQNRRELAASERPAPRAETADCRAARRRRARIEKARATADAT